MANLTKSSILVLSNDPDRSARISKTSLLVLSTISQPLYCSKTVALVLSSPSDCITKLCQCWKITRRDGIVFAYTTHNRPVTFLGVTYQVCNSLNPSAFESGIMNKRGFGDIELTGAIGQDNITEHDIANGLFDNASVEGYVVSWDETNRTNSKRILKGIVGNTKQNGSTYSMEVITVGVKLSQRPLIQVYTPSCRHELGQGLCPINLLSYSYSGSVTETVNRDGITKASFRQFYDSTTSQPNDYYNLGILVWLTGNNAGISSEIKTYRQSDGLITLWQSMPHEIEIGDTFTMFPGCDKTMDTHLNKFGLTSDTFGGFPDLPGNDAIARTPDAV